MKRSEAKELAMEMAGLNEIKEEEPKLLTEKELEDAKELFNFMYTEIIDILKEYLVLKENQYKIISIWILGTYFHEHFNTFPYLFFNAMRGSGKTRTLKLISALGAKGDGSIQNNITEAVLFRIARGTTTCIDECEQIRNKDKQMLREILNSAYKKGMKVSRMRKKKTLDGEQQVVEDFEPYFPIAMANISGMDEVLADRSITLILEKSDDPEKTKKGEDFQENLRIKWIKQTLTQFGRQVDINRQKEITQKWNFWLKMTYNNIYTMSTKATLSTNPLVKEYLKLVDIGREVKIDEETHEFFTKLNDAGIVGRNFELFMPLLTTANFISKMLFEEIFEVVKEMVREKKEEEYHESTDVSLYQFVLSKSDISEFIRIKDITREFREYVGETDNEESKWLNERWLSRALKRLNLVEYKRKVHGCFEVRLNYAKAKEKLKLFTF